MNNKLDEILRRVAEKTLESLAFMLPMSEEYQPDEAQTPTEDDSAMVASVCFSGPFGGTLFVAFPGCMLPELAENMLGLDFEAAAPTTDQQQDALKELANVICGNLLPEIAGTEAEFDVGAPQLLTQGTIPGSYRQRPPAAGAQLCLDSGSAILALFTDGPVPAAADQSADQEKEPQPHD